MVHTTPRDALDAPPLGMNRSGEHTSGKGVPAPLFLALFLLAVALAALCIYLAVRGQGTLRDTDSLEQRLQTEQAVSARLQEKLDQARRALDDSQGELAQTEAALTQAQKTIGLMQEYSLVGPDGEAPEYTRLYPDFYAPEWTGETVAGGKVCCLTFDDGPSANTDQVLATLERYGVKATFFVVGRTGEADQARMKKIAAAGHTLAMHSWSHDYRKIYASVDAFLEDFYTLYQWIHQVTGVYPTVFRFPGGSLNNYNRGIYQEIIAEMTRRGFVYFDWNASAQDATVQPRPAWDIAADCLKGVGRDLAVVLCHDSAARTTTAQALPAVIEGYQNAGYTFRALHPGVRPITFGYPKVK